jgi:serine protease AprX
VRTSFGFEKPELNDLIFVRQFKGDRMANVSRMNETAKITIIVVAMVTSLSAGAGEKLRFRTGTVSTTKPVVRGYEGTFSSDAQKPSRFFVIQFKTKIQKADQQAIKAAGLKPLRYIPDDALLVEGSADQVEALKKDRSLQAALPFISEWKLSPAFGAGSIFNARSKNSVVVRTLDAQMTESIAGQFKALGIKVDFSKGRSIAAVMSREQVRRAAEVEGVEWLQPAPQMELMHARVLDEGAAEQPGPSAEPSYDTLTGFETGTRVMNVEAAAARGLSGEGQIVSYADTGLDRGDATNIHGDFAGRADGQIFGMFASSWEDPHGHGTHVAGSIAGSGVTSGGRLSGSAPKAKLIAQSMWSPVLNNITPQSISEQLAAAEGAGALINSNSWGSTRDFGAYDAFAVQVDEYTFAHPEMLVLFAAGNSGIDGNKDGRIDSGSVSSPATAKNCLSVGASENETAVGGIQVPLGKLRNGSENWGVEPLVSDLLSNNKNGVAAFSSRGPTKDGRMKPEIVAAGTNILSTRSKHATANVLWGAYNAEYVWAGGTSMATPLTAGVAALVREYLVKQKSIARPSASLVKNILMHTAFDIFPGQYSQVSTAQSEKKRAKRF